MWDIGNKCFRFPISIISKASWFHDPAAYVAIGVKLRVDVMLTNLYVLAVTA